MLTRFYYVAARAEVTVRYEDGLVSMQIADTGDGHGTAHGLDGKRERATMLGG